MVKAYVLMVVRPGTETKVADTLNKMREVKDISVVYGEYDIVCKIMVASMDDLQKFIAKRIRGIKDVERTSTMVALK